MKSFTRRSVIKGALLCSASAAFAGMPRAIFPVDPRARIAVATYPFRALIIAPGNQDYDAKKPGMDLASFARFVRTEFKVHGIEPLDSHFASTEPNEIRKLRAAFDEAGEVLEGEDAELGAAAEGEGEAVAFEGAVGFEDAVGGGVVGVFINGVGADAVERGGEAQVQYADFCDSNIVDHAAVHPPSIGSTAPCINSASLLQR